VHALALAHAAASSSMLAPEAVNKLLLRATSPGEPLSPELANAVRAWMVASPAYHSAAVAAAAAPQLQAQQQAQQQTPPGAEAAASPAAAELESAPLPAGLGAGCAAVDRRVGALLDSLAAADAQARGPPGVAARLARGVTRLLGGGGGGGVEHADVRASHFLLPFAPRHIAGDRVPPPGAAASRPPPSYSSLAAGGAAAAATKSGAAANFAARIPTVALPFAASNGGVWPLPPAGVSAAGGGAPAGGPAPGGGLELEPCPLHCPLTLSVTLTNVGRARASVTARPLQSFGENEAYVMAVEPSALVLRRGESAQLSVTLRLLRPGALVEAFLLVETAPSAGAAGAPPPPPPVAGAPPRAGSGACGRRLMLLAVARAERTLFGVRLSDVPAVRNGGYEGIPLPLAQMRDFLLGGPDGGRARLKTEGIFRVAPSDAEKAAIRRALNDGTFSAAAAAAAASAGAGGAGGAGGPGAGCAAAAALTNPIAVAHMIKVFLRELPSPLFSAIPTETLLAATSEDECLALIGWLTPPATYIFAWLVDLFVEVARYEAQNKMTHLNLAVCTGPNLFAGDEAVNPMQALIGSQRAVQALFRVISARAAGGGGARDIFAEFLGVSAPPVIKQQIFSAIVAKRAHEDEGHAAATAFVVEGVGAAGVVPPARSSIGAERRQGALALA